MDQLPHIDPRQQTLWQEKLSATQREQLVRLYVKAAQNQGLAEALSQTAPANDVPAHNRRGRRFSHRSLSILMNSGALLHEAMEHVGDAISLVYGALDIVPRGVGSNIAEPVARRRDLALKDFARISESSDPRDVEHYSQLCDILQAARAGARRQLEFAGHGRG